MFEWDRLSRYSVYIHNMNCTHTQTHVCSLPVFSWPPLCHPSSSPGEPGRWTPPQTDAPRRTPACPSSWDPSRCSMLSTDTHTHTHTHTNRCYFCSLSFFQVKILSPPDMHWFCYITQLWWKEEIRTVICFIGMKSALCLTRSKILASWGLMKASSEIKQKRAILLGGER